MGILRPDLKSVVWLGLGFFVAPVVIPKIMGLLNRG